MLLSKRLALLVSTFWQMARCSLRLLISVRPLGGYYELSFVS